MDPPSSPPAPRRPADAHDRTSSDDTIGPSPTLAPAPLPPTSSTLSNSQASLGRGAPPPAPTSPKGKARTQSASTTSSILFAPAPWTTPIPSPSRKPTRILQGARPFSAASGYFDEGGSVVEEEEEGEEGWERKGKAVRGVRSTSVVPSGSKGRSKSRAREVVEEEEPVREGDDEVARRDRGEELVRKRMKDRARVKKVRSFLYSGGGRTKSQEREQEAEKASRKRESDARRTQLDLARRASYNPTAFSYDLDADLDRSVSGAGVLPPLARRSTEGARSRDVSRSGRDSVMSQSTEGGRFASEAGTQRALPWETGSEAPLSPALGRAGGVDGARDEEIMSEGRSLKEGEVDSGNEEDIESGILEEEEDEDDTEVGGEVEYTLKDRQDVSRSPRRYIACRTDFFDGRPSTSSTPSVSPSGSPPSTRSLAPSPATPKPLFTPLPPPPLFVTSPPVTSSGPSSSASGSTSSASSSAPSCGVSLGAAASTDASFTSSAGTSFGRSGSTSRALRSSNTVRRVTTSRR